MVLLIETRKRFALLRDVTNYGPIDRNKEEICSASEQHYCAMFESSKSKFMLTRGPNDTAIILAPMALRSPFAN